MRQEREVGDTNEATWKEERKPAEIETEIGGVPRERERERERGWSARNERRQWACGEFRQRRELDVRGGGGGSIVKRGARERSGGEEEGEAGGPLEKKSAE